MPLFHYPKEKEYIFEDGVPVNAVAGGVELSVAEVPDAYIKNVQAKRTYTVEDVPAINVQSKITLTVASQPLSAVAEVNAFGEIEVTGTPEVNDTLTLGRGLDEEVYTFVAARSGANEITISATPSEQATNIATAINTDSEITDAASDGAIATITAIEGGAAGNSIVFVASSLALSLSGEGTLGGGVTAVTADTIVFCKGDAEEETFTFVANGATPGENEIEIGETTAETASNIVSTVSITTIGLSLAETPDNTFTVTAVASGTAGNGIEIDADGTRISGDGVTAGGVDATELTIGTDVYTFIAAGEAAGELEINIGNASETAANIAALSPLDAVAITDNEDGTFTIIAIFAELPGADGNGYVVTPDGTYISGTSNLAGGVDEVKSYLEIDGKEYIFYNAAGDNPEGEYPNCVKVAIGTVDETTTNLVTALKLDTSNFSDVSVTKNGYVITANYKTKGVAGNSITYANHLITAADITDNLGGAGHFIGGVNGTPGEKGRTFFSDGVLYVCTATNFTTANDNWIEVKNNYELSTNASIDLKAKSRTIDYFYAELNANSNLILNDINNTGLMDGFARHIIIKNTHATDTILIAFPSPNLCVTTSAPILACTYLEISFCWNPNISAWVIRYSDFEVLTAS